MNTIHTIESYGFKITWKLLEIGLCGTNDFGAQLDKNDITEYLKDSFNSENQYITEAISLVCEEDSIKFKNLLKEYAQIEHADEFNEWRKWRVFLLTRLLDNINNNDYFHGLLELIEFWDRMGREECPILLPDSKCETLSVDDYFTQTVYDESIMKNKSWIMDEVETIISHEK